jgi:hypothetical protein
MSARAGARPWDGQARKLFGDDDKRKVRATRGFPMMLVLPGFSLVISRSCVMQHFRKASVGQCCAETKGGLRVSCL